MTSSTDRTQTGRRSPPLAAGLPGAFDEHHPPSPELIGDCVHCGFCLPTCPTYNLWGEEMDSPRGRIYLMKSGLEGEPMTDSMVQHFDACLGCMACVTACPSGVQYDKLIEATRAQVERNHDRSPGDRALRGAIFALFPYKRRLRLLRGPLRAYQAQRAAEAAPPQPAAGAAGPEAGRDGEPGAAARRKRERVPARVPAVGPRRAVVGLLTGCVQGEFFPGVNAATARVLAAEGCDVIVPPSQGCCGALSVHNGREPEAKRFARGDHRRVREGGRGHRRGERRGLRIEHEGVRRPPRRRPGLRRTGTGLLRPGPRHLGVPGRARDRGASGIRSRSASRTTTPATSRTPRASGSSRAALLGEIPGLEVREIADAAICCGSAGIWNVLNPEPARELGDRKAKNIVATGAALLVTANPGCLMQVAASLDRQGARVGMAHTIEVLDASIRGLPVSALGRPGTAPTPLTTK